MAFMRGFGPVFAIVLLVLLDASFGKILYHRQEFDSKDHKESARNYLERVVNASQELLKVPPTLDLGDTPRTALDVQHNLEHSRILIGLVVENYADFNLTDPVFSEKEGCPATANVFHPMPVAPGTFEFSMFDNGGYNYYGICGTVSWQITNPDGSPMTDPKRPTMGKRLVVSYHVYHNCNDDEPNTLSINVMDSRLDSKHKKWINADKYKYYAKYDIFDKYTRSLLIDDTDDHLAFFAHHRFLIGGSIESGCKPVAKVQFLPGPAYKAHLFKQNLPIADARRVPQNGDSSTIDTVNKAFADLSHEDIIKYSVMGSLGLVAFVLFVCLVRALARKGRQGRVRNRREG